MSLLPQTWVEGSDSSGSFSSFSTDTSTSTELSLSDDSTYLLSNMPTQNYPQFLGQAPSVPTQQLTPQLPQFTPQLPQLTPQQPQLTPQLPQFTPQLPQLTPQLPQLTPQLPQLTPQQPQLTPQQPQLTPQLPQFTPQLPQFTPQQAQLTPQLPQLTPQQAQLTPQLPQLTPQQAQLTPQLPQLTPQITPQLTPQLPQLTPQQPQFTPQLTPQQPQFTPQQPQLPQLTPQFTPQLSPEFLSQQSIQILEPSKQIDISNLQLSASITQPGVAQLVPKKFEEKIPDLQISVSNPNLPEIRKILVMNIDNTLEGATYQQRTGEISPVDVISQTAQLSVPATVSPSMTFAQIPIRQLPQITQQPSPPPQYTPIPSQYRVQGYQSIGLPTQTTIMRSPSMYASQTVKPSAAMATQSLMVSRTPEQKIYSVLSNIDIRRVSNKRSTQSGGSYSLGDLRSFLRNMNQTITGNKKELVERIQRLYDIHMRKRF